MNNPKPPRLASFLVWLRHNRTTAESLLGDLAEEFITSQRSNAWYWGQALSTLGFGGVKLRPGKEGGVQAGLPNGFWNDIRYAARSLRKNPGVTAMAMVAIALGIGVNTVVFTLFNAIALRPLPVPDAGRVIAVYQVFQGKNTTRYVNGSSSYFSLSEYQNYRGGNHVLSGLAAYYPGFSATLAGERPRELSGQLASCNYFDVVNVQPVLGRGFRQQECGARNAGPVVVLSDKLWRGAFGADPEILGKSITLNRVPLTVVGVASPGFHGADAFASDFWVPLSMDPSIHPGDSLANENLSWLAMVGRLKPGVTVAAARADLSVIAGRIDRLYPGRKTTLSVDVANFMGEPEMRHGLLQVTSVIFAAVGLVLLIACANVANLLLARGTARKKEIAVRLSVGATRGRLIRQLLTESVLLALPGAAAGALLAAFASGTLLRWMLSHLPVEIPLAFNGAPDLRVLIFTLGLSVLTGIVFGLAPALQSSRPDLTLALKEESAGAGTHRSTGFLRGALVAAQVSVCLVLLITAGLLVRGILAAQSIEPGFQARNVSVTQFDLKLQGYDDTRAAAFHRALQERVSAIPGVDAVGRATVAPLSMNVWGTAIRLPGQNAVTFIHYDAVTPEYFSVLAIPIVRGRNFLPSEENAHAKVAIVMESTARKLWPDQDPLGKIFSAEEGPKGSESFQIVGVAKDTHTSSLSAVDPYFFYFPLSSDDQLAAQLLVHSKIPPAETERNIIAAARRLDPNVLARVRQIEDNIDLYRVPGRIAAALAAVLGGFALLLASVGIYGVVSYTVSRRIREIGIRVTLGARAGEVVRLMMRGAMIPVLCGALLGLLACMSVSRILSSVLYGINPLDPLAFAGVTLFLLGVALLASYVPARRAARVDPMDALRYE